MNGQFHFGVMQAHSDYTISGRINHQLQWPPLLVADWLSIELPSKLRFFIGYVGYSGPCVEIKCG